jgi:N-acetylmuramoyl-L-alanine amidase
MARILVALVALATLTAGCGSGSSAPANAGSQPTAKTGVTSPATTTPTTTVAPPATTTPPATSTQSSTSAPPTTTTAPETLPPKADPPKPHIVWKPIPFSAQRRAEMAAYSKRHYGIDSWRLVHPHVIVEHYTATSTFSSAYNTFAQDVPDSELHELPGTCAHFIVDRDGTIYQLVPLTTMCRHTVGLNYTAIGIEHVGTSDGEILGDAAQLDASLKLTLWLMWRYHIPLGDVIGHNESLTSPYHKELYPAWRCQTHSDWLPPDIHIYKLKLATLARRYHVPIGPYVRPVNPHC